MSDLALATSSENAIPVHVFKPGEVLNSAALSDQDKTWAKANGFDGQVGRTLLVPDSKGQISLVLFGSGKPEEFNLPLITGSLGSKLPKGIYEFAAELEEPHLAALGWLFGSYTFSNYKNKAAKKAKLVLPPEVEQQRLETEANATFLARDLINIPANDMGPNQLEATIKKIAKAHKAKVSVIKGDELLKQNFPMIHA
ncbi:MAG: leucyl aminopeptidase family protein, partial [Pseudomonadota bacterium]